MGAGRRQTRPRQCLYYLPDPQGQGALRETLPQVAGSPGRRSRRGTLCDRTARRLRSLAKTTGLTRTDVRILELMLRYQTRPVIESTVEDVPEGGGAADGAGGRDAGALSIVLTLTRRAPSSPPVSSQLRGEVGEAVAGLMTGDDAVGAKVAKIATQLTPGRQHRDLDVVDDGKRQAGALGQPFHAPEAQPPVSPSPTLS